MTHPNGRLIKVVNLKTISPPTQTLLEQARALADYISQPGKPEHDKMTLDTMPYLDRVQLTNTIRLMCKARKAELQCDSPSSATSK